MDKRRSQLQFHQLCQTLKGIFSGPYIAQSGCGESQIEARNKSRLWNHLNTKARNWLKRGPQVEISGEVQTDKLTNTNDFKSNNDHLRSELDETTAAATTSTTMTATATTTTTMTATAATTTITSKAQEIDRK